MEGEGNDIFLSDVEPRGGGHKETGREKRRNKGRRQQTPPPTRNYDFGTLERDKEEPLAMEWMMAQDTRMDRLESTIASLAQLLKVPVEPKEDQDKGKQPELQEGETSGRTSRQGRRPQTRRRRPVSSSDDGSDSESYGRFKPCPSEKFRGKRNSLAVSKWLRDMEQYLDLQRVGKRHWVKIAASFLADDADAWFLAESAREEFKSWKEFKAAFEEYFIPQNESFKLRDEWRGLKQEGPLSEYIRKYRRLMLQITEMHDLDRLHGFLYGCSVWTRREIEKQSPPTWEEAIVMAERYQDAESNCRAQSMRRTENISPRRNQQGAGNTNTNTRPANTTQNTGNVPVQRNQNNYGNNQQRALPAPQWQRNDPRPFCRTCRGNHWTHQCTRNNNQTRVQTAQVEEEPQRRNTNVVLTELDDNDEEVQTGNNAPHVGTVAAMPGCFPMTLRVIQNMYFWGTFGNKRKAVLVDSGATHNFMSPQCAASLQLALSKLPEMSVTFAQGRDDNVKIALNVRMTMGEWSAKLDFLVVPLESFDVIVGLSFMDRYMVSMLGKGMDKLLLDMQGNIVVVDCYRSPRRAPEGKLEAQGKSGKVEDPGSSSQESSHKTVTPPTTKEEADRQRKGKAPM
ncbi:hypothetical protein KP509_04G005900 [Ceratopteris richardii]|uniref:Retrotransposon gag domain-containing protein n=1 Tax=Ceratopteris richardii TaxID=49495 RepID=A0A8T2UPU8_CERRI|nr:hypothetical protein KP509_04G005900 [Ceratopteris richardii]